MKNKENVILIGFMGAGKTTVGKQLSYYMEKGFRDADREIERLQGKSIQKIFESVSEEGFRKIETEYLRQLKKNLKNEVLSCGGGMILKEENRVLLHELGTVVYLKATQETVLKRVFNGKRPLANGPDGEERIKTLYQSRKDIYEQVADYSVTVDDLEVREIVEKIAKRLEKNA